jgi:hypothetical protein
MRIVANYRKHAEECRKLARLATNPEDRKVFEDMTDNWTCSPTCVLAILSEKTKGHQFLLDNLVQIDSDQLGCSHGRQRPVGIFDRY